MESLSYNNIATELNRLTKVGHENIYLKLINTGTPSVLDRLGNLDVKRFANVCGSIGIGGTAADAAVSRLTGRNLESVYHERIMPTVKSRDKILSKGSQSYLSMNPRVGTINSIR